MTTDDWLSNFELISVDDLASSSAQKLVSCVERYADEIATIVEIRRSSDEELVLLNVQTGRPQHSAYNIKAIEPIAVCFGTTDEMPCVLLLRESFPDTPHQLVTKEGMPPIMCVDDREWDEARLTWTPGDLLQRISSWFQRASSGKMHDARQPLDPNMFRDLRYLTISREALECASELELVGVLDEKGHHVRVNKASQLNNQNPNRICLVVYKIPPIKMQRMDNVPVNLSSLAAMLSKCEFNLLDDLKFFVSTWIGSDKPQKWRFNSQFAVIVEMPVQAPDGAPQDGVDLRAFITGKTFGEIAVTLGLASKDNTGLSGVGYVPLVSTKKVDIDALHPFNVISAEVHIDFDRAMATQLASRANEDERDVVLVGAGAIGSHVAECLVREGRFRWTIIDDDHLLPHNLARHIGRDSDVTKEKAQIVASAISNTVIDAKTISNSIFAKVNNDGPERDNVNMALTKADIVIDATASVAAERYLSDHVSAARRVSIFLNPTGDAAVLLSEPADRSITLRDLEAQYYIALMREEELAAHLTAPEGIFQYIGACRAITNQIPQSRVLTLSGLVSIELGDAVDQSTGLIKIWSLDKSGSVKVHEAKPAPIEIFQVEEWNITIDHGLIKHILAMRKRHLPKETGGVLTGIIDNYSQEIHIVDAAPQPVDSDGSGSGFIRGKVGVSDYLESVKNRTIGQVSYIGEWHSHPPSASTQPSRIDLDQISWLASLSDVDSHPILMLIAGDQEIRIILAGSEASKINKNSKKLIVKKTAKRGTKKQSNIRGNKASKSSERKGIKAVAKKLGKKSSAKNAKDQKSAGR